MKGTVISFFCFVLFIGSLAAQLPVQREPDWRIFAPKGEEFSTQIPVEPRVSNSAQANIYSGRVAGTYFFVFSESKKNQAGLLKSALAYVRNQQPRIVAETYGEITSEKFEFADTDGFHHRVFAFTTAGRLYLLHTVSEDINDPLVSRFFEKLEIGKANLVDSVAVSDTTHAIGSGIGVPVNRNPAEGSMRQIKNDAAAVIPLRIISKPRPGYTDAGRIYRIEGTVVLKITFSADGTVGSVTAVSKLPMGLTQSSISAARAIAFEPATHGGKPVDAVKVVEYTFLIY
jgi:hypothetical protein